MFGHTRRKQNKMQWILVVLILKNRCSGLTCRLNENLKTFPSWFRTVFHVRFMLQLGWIGTVLRDGSMNLGTDRWHFLWLGTWHSYQYSSTPVAHGKKHRTLLCIFHSSYTSFCGWRDCKKGSRTISWHFYIIRNTIMKKRDCWFSVSRHSK